MKDRFSEMNDSAPKQGCSIIWSPYMGIYRYITCRYTHINHAGIAAKNSVRETIMKENPQQGLRVGESRCRRTENWRTHAETMVNYEYPYQHPLPHRQSPRPSANVAGEGPPGLEFDTQSIWPFCFSVTSSLWRHHDGYPNRYINRIQNTSSLIALDE